MRLKEYIGEGCKSKLNEEGQKYVCDECGWVYDPAKTGKEFSEEPSDYKCPKCGVPKSQFSKV